MPKSGAITKDPVVKTAAEKKIWLINAIIDMMFDPATEPTPEIQARFAAWLIDPADAELKEKAMMRKFDESILNNSASEK